MKKSNEFLYNLIPTTYRYHDNQLQNQAVLRAVMAYLQKDFDVLHENIGQLKDNWFIESCQDWCVPYIADALGLDLTHPELYALSQRAKIANYIARQQYQGTLSTVERVGFDTAKWYVKTKKFVDNIAQTNSFHYPSLTSNGSVYLNITHLPPVYHQKTIKKAKYTADLRRGYQQNHHTLGFYIWRQPCYQIIQMQCRLITDHIFNIHALGIYSPLMTLALTNSSNSKTLHDKNMPVKLTTDNFFENYGEYGSFYILWKNAQNQLLAIEKENIILAKIKQLNPTMLQNQTKVAVDLESGVIAFPRNQPQPSEVFVNACYNFNQAIGAGNDAREIEVIYDDSEDTWSCYVAKQHDFSNKTKWDIPHYKELQLAIEAWLATKKNGRIIIDDNSIYSLSTSETLKTLVLTSHCSLTIIAHNTNSPTIDFSLPVKTLSENQLILNGLFVNKTLQIDGTLNLTIDNCTFNPNMDCSIEMKNSNNANITILSSIIGRIIIPAAANHLTILDSIIDGKNNIALSGTQNATDCSTHLSCQRTTIKGLVYAQQVGNITDCIFTEALNTLYPNEGKVSHSFIPIESTVNNLVFCQPDNTIKIKIADKKNQYSDWYLQQYKQEIAATLTPSFISTNYGESNYMQLATNSPSEISHGASDKGELGAFNQYKQTLQRKNYEDELNDYAPIEYDRKMIFIS